MRARNALAEFYGDEVADYVTDSVSFAPGTGCPLETYNYLNYCCDGLYSRGAQAKE